MKRNKFLISTVLEKQDIPSDCCSKLGSEHWRLDRITWDLCAEDCSKSSKTKNHVNVPAIVTASLWQSLLNSLYDERVITHPQAGPREKIICLAASFQISNVRRFSHLGVVKAFRPSNAPGRLKLRKAKMITEKNHFERETS